MGRGAGVKSVVFAFWLCRLASGQTPEVLRVRTPIDRAIQPKEVHRYQIHFVRGQLLHLTARQSGADIVLTLIRPDGGELARSDLSNGAFGLETIAVRATVAGDYGVSVHGDGPWPEGSRYELR